MKKIFLALCLFCASASIMPAASYEKTTLTFGVSYDDSNTYPDKTRTPVKRPTAYISGHTLYIYGCEGCVLQLVQNGEVVYSTVIASDTVELPETFTGNYDLQIVRGNICFWTEIEL